MHRFAAALYGAAAGILYGFMAALMKDITATISDDGLAATFGEWQLYVLVVCGLGAIVLQQLALRSGHLSAGLSAISVGTPVMSTILGITIFEETFSTEGVQWVAYGRGRHARHRRCRRCSPARRPSWQRKRRRRKCRNCP